MMRPEQNYQEEIDPRLKALLEELVPVPPRTPEAMARGKARFLAEMDEIFQSNPIPPPAVSSRRKPSRSIKEIYTMLTLKHRFALTMITLVFVLMLFFGGASITASAAQSALPGDALYPLKTGLEQTQARLSGDAVKQSQMFLSFAQRRLDEIADLIAEGRFDDISTATQEFEDYVQKSLFALTVAAEQDPAQASRMVMEVSQTLSLYAETLGSMAANVPDTFKDDFQEAIRASHSAPSFDDQHGDEIEFNGVLEAITDQVWTISGQEIAITSATEIHGSPGLGDTVKVHVFVAGDGKFTARQIELVTADSGQNANDNDDSNANDNDDSNANDNDNGNANNDDNGNANNDDNGNANNDDNGNANNDDNGNANNDDNGNANNDDNGNDNGNGNDNDDGGSGDSNGAVLFPGITGLLISSLSFVKHLL